MKTARLLVADSEHDANMLYAVGIFVPDPFIWLEIGGRTIAVLSDLEIDRARKQATVDRVVSLTRYQNELRRTGVKLPCLSDALKGVLSEFGIGRVEVPSNFPIGLARKLRRVQVTVRSDPFFPEREIKRNDEIRKLAVALRLAEDGMEAAIEALRSARIGRDGFLWRKRSKVNSEQVQGIINATIAGRGGVASHTIVAGGNQGCDPHEAGHGPLRAHQSIIIDIFPRDGRTGYWGDITRTVVRGRASDAVKRLYLVVSQGQDLAFKELRDGVNGREIHESVLRLFRENGFATGRRDGRMQGFFHGTGHGLGLEIHERPRVCAVDARLLAGHVVTVEPGLYYWGIGGVRLEDVAVVQSKGARNLTKFPKFLEI
jgi:Xaa-Pro aminopeptidase